MRSSKNRSRSKGNRNRSVGNIVNRVFDSSGPEGKVRGTPQQIIDKYNQLARDAQLGNDRVAAENFQQHSEHYTRMLSEAQREMEARREQQDQQRAQKQQQRDDRDDGAAQQQPEAVEAGGAQGGFSDVIDTGAGGDIGLVETPEGGGRSRRGRGRRPRDESSDQPPAEGPSGDNPQEAAE